MAILKYSRQREAIKSYLFSTTSHPTADTVYMHVREEFPNISLGTVYRNLNLLTDLGEAVKITTPDGADRFDGNTNPHYHFCCLNCGNVYDLDMPDLDELNKYASKFFDGKIVGHTILFHGTCKHCLKEAKEKRDKKGD